MRFAMFCIFAMCSFTVATVNADRIDTVAGDGQKSVVGQPFGVEVGPDGALYICEVQNHPPLLPRLCCRSCRMTSSTYVYICP